MDIIVTSLLALPDTKEAEHPVGCSASFMGALTKVLLFYFALFCFYQHGHFGQLGGAGLFAFIFEFFDLNL